jgi:hypothetical protein
MYFAALLMSAPPSHVSNKPKKQPTTVTLTSVLWEVVDERDLWQLLLKDINLVQEQDDRCPQEPARVDNRLEQHQRLLHTVLAVLLEKHLIVFGKGNTENDRGDRLETCNALVNRRYRLQG